MLELAASEAKTRTTMNTTLIKIQKIKDIDIERIDEPYVYPRSTDKATRHRPEKYNPVKVRDSEGKLVNLHVNIDESIKKIPALNIFVKNLIKGYSEEIGQKTKDLQKQIKEIQSENRKLKKQIKEIKNTEEIRNENRKLKKQIKETGKINKRKKLTFIEKLKMLFRNE